MQSSAIKLAAYLEDQLGFVLDIVRPSPGWLGSGHLDDDTANAPHITLPPIPSGGALLSGASTYNLSSGRTLRDGLG